MTLARDLVLLKRGAAINVLGAVGRLALAASPLLGVRLFGDAYGALALNLAGVGIVAFFCSAGFSDAVQFLCAHDGDRVLDAAQRERMAGVVLIAMTLSGLLALIASLSLHFWGTPIGRLAFGRSDLGRLLSVVSLGIPFVAVTAIATAALRSSMRMGGDVFVKSFVIPIFFLGGALFARRFTVDPVGMAWAYVLAQAVGALFALAILARKIPLSHPVRAIQGAPLRALMKFALPQSLNMALYQATFDLDIVLLGAAGTPDRLLGAYRVASEVSRQIFTIRVTFAGAYASLVARLQHEGRATALSDSIGIVTGWCVQIAAPVGILFIMHRDDLFTLAHFADVPSTFFVVLVFGSVCSCAFGLTGNVLGMTGHPALNLVNAVGATGFNVLGNLLLVPHHGLMGAAIATTTGLCITQMAQVFETRVWLGVRLPLLPIARPVAQCALAVLTALVLQWLLDLQFRWQLSIAFVLAYGLFFFAFRKRRIA
ncbi:MAG: polysaccharide biosynthesis C-terminal domain-containing protein [Deltaproteobacteria bacterium]|nr:polysaccharide biosynthesis C-terminal domain-containing protein [Deltaproteobacteria bacterium]